MVLLCVENVQVLMFLFFLVCKTMEAPNILYQTFTTFVGGLYPIINYIPLLHSTFQTIMQPYFVSALALCRALLLTKLLIDTL